MLLVSGMPKGISPNARIEGECVRREEYEHLAGVDAAGERAGAHHCVANGAAQDVRPPAGRLREDGHRCLLEPVLAARAHRLAPPMLVQ